MQNAAANICCTESGACALQSLETYMGGACSPAGDKHGHVTVVPPSHCPSPVNKLYYCTRPATQYPRARDWGGSQHPSKTGRWVPAGSCGVGEGTAVMNTETGRAGAARSKASGSSTTPISTAPTAKPHSRAGLPAIPSL